MSDSLDHAAVSDIGCVRSENQDRWFADDRRGLYIVADGVGGERAGGLAAEVVVETLPLLIDQQMRDLDDLSSSDARHQLRDCLTTLSDRLRDESQGQPGLDGMSSTVVLALIRGSQVLIGHMGDSRAYMLRSGELKLLTTDHSLTQLLVTSGEISAAEAESHPARGQLTRYIGMEGEGVADVRSLTLEPNDRLLLCSDGLTKAITEDDIVSCLGGKQDLKAACDELLARVNLVGAQDNVTMILVEQDRP